jgi:hypothetical protein
MWRRKGKGGRHDHGSDCDAGVAHPDRQKPEEGELVRALEDPLI